MRTFLVGPTRARAELLAREVSVTTALLESEEPINCLKAFDSTGSVNYQQLSEKIGFEASGVDFAEAVSTEPQALADCADPVDFVIAYGAALAHLEKPQSINFRSDFMPYQGKKQRMEKALKFASVSVTVLLLALGVYFQMPLLKTNEYRSRLRKKFAKEYKAVMPGRMLPDKFVAAQKRLDGELRRIKDHQSGRFGAAGEESMLSKLTLVLEAFNNCAAPTNLKINKISVTEKIIRIQGDTASFNKTLELRKSIEKSNLEILQDNITEQSGRSVFSITVVPKK
jgi:hypothetical protein